MEIKKKQLLNDLIIKDNYAISFNLFINVEERSTELQFLCFQKYKYYFENVKVVSTIIW